MFKTSQASAHRRSRDGSMYQGNAALRALTLTWTMRFIIIIISLRAHLLVLCTCTCLPRVSASTPGPKPAPETGDWVTSLNATRDGAKKLYAILDEARNLYGADGGECQYRCDDGYKLVPRPGYKQAPPNGCAFMLFGLELPDIGIPCVTKCCNQHDICYDTCGKEKYDCDKQFQDCLDTICRDMHKTLGIDQSAQACEPLTTLVFDAVDHFGCNLYLDSQRESCVCQHEVKEEL